MAGLFPPAATEAYERRTVLTGNVTVEGVTATLAQVIALREGGNGSGEVGGCAMLVSASGYLLEVVCLVLGRRSVSRPYRRGSTFPLFFLLGSSFLDVCGVLTLTVA